MYLTASNEGRVASKQAMLFKREDEEENVAHDLHLRRANYK